MNSSNEGYVKKDNWEKYGGKLGKIIFIVLLICFSLVTYVGSEIYRRNYHPEMSVFEFVPFQVLIIFSVLIPLILIVYFFIFGFKAIFRGLTDKKNQLKWNEWVAIIYIPVTLLAVETVYRSIKLYSFNHPDILFREWIVMEFFACAYTAAFVSWGGIVVTGLVLRKYFGFKSLSETTKQKPL